MCQILLRIKKHCGPPLCAFFLFAFGENTVVPPYHFLTLANFHGGGTCPPCPPLSDGPVSSYPAGDRHTHTYIQTEFIVKRESKRRKRRGEEKRVSCIIKDFFMLPDSALHYGLAMPIFPIHSHPPPHPKHLHLPLIPSLSIALKFSTHMIHIIAVLKGRVQEKFAPFKILSKLESVETRFTTNPVCESIATLISYEFLKLPVCVQKLQFNVGALLA